MTWVLVLGFGLSLLLQLPTTVINFRALGSPTSVELTATEAFNPQVPGVHYGVLDTLVGYAIRRAQIKLYEDFIATLAPWDITPPRYSALVIIANNPGLKLTDLARILGIARSGAVMLIDALEGMGYVARLPARSGDRRAHALELTSKGEGDLQAIVEAVVEHDRRMTRALNDDERHTLVGMLQRISMTPRAKTSD